MTESNAQRAAPTDRGLRLATIQRGESEEFRICWDEFKGHPYVSLRVWTRSAAWQWWPDKTRGCSIRVRELDEFSQAIERAMDRAARTVGPSSENDDQ